MLVNPKYRNLLKEPFGLLIEEDGVNRERILVYIEKSIKIVTVGDTTTDKLLNFGFIPNLYIIDNKEKRILKDTPIEYDVEKKIYCENKPGEISEQVIDIIKEITVIDFNRIQIIIDGEEDLLALPLFMLSPNNWTIFYGQPNVGLVVVEIDQALRKKAKSIFNRVFFS
ncbi:MAG: GTP-dependent dephospho-CoA kinase family protein [Candidatus Nitrosocosmicus sp.]